MSGCAKIALFSKNNMSYKIQDAVWERADYRGETMMVLLALAGYASSEGICWPAQDTLAKRARVSRRGLQYIIRRLVEAGDIEIEQAGGAGERGRSSTVYRLSRYVGAPDAPLACDDRGMACAPQAHGVRPTGEVGAPIPAHGMRPTGAPDAPLPAHGVRPNLSVESVSESVNESITESAQARESLRNRIGDMFGRQAGSLWSKAEVIALEAVASLGTPDADIDALRRYYRSSIPADKDYRRRTVGSLLEHWHGELDRARAWVREQKRKANSIL